MKLLSICLLLALLGCETMPQQHSTLATSREFNAPLETVWPLLVTEVASKYPVKVVEKQSGLLTTDFVMMPAGFNNSGAKQWVYQPSVFLGTWNGLRMNLSAIATQPQPGKTLVSLNTHFEAFEDNVNKGWMGCETKGTLEDSMLNDIAAKIH